MAKGAKSVFFCQNCGYESAKWMGQCPGCREWNTFAEEKVITGKNAPGGRAGGSRMGAAQVVARVGDTVCAEAEHRYVIDRSATDTAAGE